MAGALKINTGLVGREFAGTEKAFVATTLKGATDAAAAFGRFKMDGRIPLASGLEEAAETAVMKADRNGDVPAILVVDRKANALGSNGSMPKEVESLSLDKAVLLVLDEPEAQAKIREAIKRGELDLTPLLSVYTVNAIGGKVDNKTPFSSAISYFNLGMDESY